MSKILVKEAEVFDGEKNIGIKDILIKDNKISQIGVNIDLKDAEIIDGKGKYLAPGFIDVHTHSDLQVVNTDNLNFLSQGVTTVIGGNCGISAGIDNGIYQRIINFDEWQPNNWKSYADYYNWLKSKKPILNYFGLIGYHSLIEESQYRKKTVRDILKEYFYQKIILGLSFGLEYGWGRDIKDISEIIDLIELTANNDGIVCVHLKDQGVGLFDSVKTFIQVYEILKVKQLRIEISHLKHKFFLDRNGQTRLKETLDLIEKYRSRGCHIAIDAYPYTSSSTVLKTDSADQCQNGWKDVYVNGAKTNIAEMAIKIGISEVKFVEQILKNNPKATGVYHNVMRENDVWEILEKDYCWVGSDGLPNHPRMYGTFTKILKKIYKENRNKDFWLKKMTSGPASFYKLKDIGYLKPGYQADLVLFDWKNISDKANFDNPEGVSSGINKLIIKGKIVFSS